MIRIIAIGCVALLVATGGGAWYLLGTTGGAVRLIDFGGRWLPGDVEVTGVAGSLLTELSAARVVYRQQDITVTASAIRLDLDLRRLAAGVLVIDEALAETVRLNDTPVELRVRLSGAARLSPDLPLDAALEWSDRPTGWRGSGRFNGTLERLEFTQVVELPERLHIDGVIDYLLVAPAVSATARWAALTLPEQTFGALVSSDGEALIDGTLADYRLAAKTLLIRDADQQLTLSLKAHGDVERLVVDALRLESLGAVLDAAGTVEFGEPPVVRLATSGRDFDPGLLLPGYDGRLSFDAAVDARWPARLAIRVDRLDGDFLGSPISGTGDVLAIDGQLERADARLRSGANSLRMVLSGRPRLSGEFELDAPDLASLWPGLAGELRGSGSVTGTREAPRIAVDLSGAGIHFGEQRVERLRIVGQADAETGVDFDARADGAQFAGQVLGDLTVSGSGTIDAHKLAVTLSGGPVSTGFDVSGSWDGQQLQERIANAILETEIGAWTLRDSFVVTADDAGFGVSAHCWDDGLASICTEGLEARGEQLKTGAVLTRFPVQTFNAWLGDEFAIEGEASATFSFERSATGFSAVVDWRQTDTRLLFDAAVEDMLVESEIETRLSRLELKLVADDEAALLSGEVIGTFGLKARVEARLENPLAADGALSGFVRAEVPDIGELRPLVDRYVPTEGLEGSLLVDVRLGGTRDEPSLDGGARLQDGAATIPLFGIRVEDIQVEVFAGEDQNLAVEGSARSGEGVVELSGVIGVAPDTGLFADIAIRGERFQLVRLPDQSALISPDLTARFDGGQILLGGRVQVPEAAFEFRELGEAAVVTSDDVIVHRAGTEPDDSASYTRIAGQLDIELGDAVTFQGLGLRTRLTGGLLLTFRSGSPPAGEGSFQLVDGTFETLGREMVIERGSLNFYGPLDDPVVDARATRRIRYEARDIKLGIMLSGRLSQQLVFTLFSEPPMSESDVLSFMVVGRPSTTAEGDDAAVSGAALALGLQSLSATRRAGESLTLDEISFEGGGADDTSVVAGKRLGERWYVRYTYGLFSRVGTFIIRYDIGRGVSVEAGSGAQQSLDLIYSIER